MVPIVLMLCAAQGLPRWSESGKHEAWTPRPSRRAPVDRQTDPALLLALDWLIRNQADDGSWEAEDGGSRVGVTGVALLAFLGAGFSTWAQEDCAASGCRSGSPRPYRGPPSPHHTTVRKAIGFLVRAQEADSHRDRAIVALALVEAYGVSRLRGLVEVAGKAIQGLEIGGDDSAFGWTYLALRSAAIYGIPYSRTLLDQLAVTVPLPSPDPRQRCALEFFLWRERRRKDGRRDVPSIRPLVDHPPTWKAGEIDPHAWYWGTIALNLFDGRDGPGARPWNKALKEALLKNQGADGSWAPPGRGKATSTALFSLTLTPHYQFASYGLW